MHSALQSCLAGSYEMHDVTVFFFLFTVDFDALRLLNICEILLENLYYTVATEEDNG